MPVAIFSKVLQSFLVPVYIQVASMKVLIPMAILVAIATVLLCAPNPRHNQFIPALEFGAQGESAYQETQGSQHNQENESLVTVTIRNSGKQTPITQGGEPDSHYISTESLYRACMWATIVGVAVALGGLVALFIQTGAAKASADSLKNIERPWLLLSTIERWSVKGGDNSGHIGIRWTLKNFGKTPALVQKIEGNVDIVSPDYKFPKEPIYKKPYSTIYEQPIIPPGESSFPIVHALDRCWGKTELSDVAHGKVWLIASGHVAYKDPFGASHETRFCLRSGYEEFNIADSTAPSTPVGPEEYNKCT